MEPTAIPPRCRAHPGRHSAGCTACRTRSAWDQRCRKAERAKGLTRRVPIGPAQAHLEALVAQGMSMVDIAAISGVSHRALVRLHQGLPAFTLHDTATAILAVTYKPRRDRLDGTGVRRRLRALARIGWDYGHLGRQLGVSRARVAQLTQDEKRFTQALCERVEKVYDRLAWTPGPSVRRMREAMAQGWVSPAAWDAETIDDPAAVPVLDIPRDDQDDVDDVDQDVDHGKVWLAIGGDGVAWRDLSHAEKTAAVTELVRHYPDDVIAARLRTTRDNVAKFREREEIPAHQPSGRLSSTVELSDPYPAVRPTLEPLELVSAA